MVLNMVRAGLLLLFFSIYTNFKFTIICCNSTICGMHYEPLLAAGFSISKFYSVQ